MFTQTFIQAQIKENIKAQCHGLCGGNSPVTEGFPAKMDSYAENVSIWWRHHVGSWYNHETKHKNQCAYLLNNTARGTRCCLKYFLKDDCMPMPFSACWNFSISISSHDKACYIPIWKIPATFSRKGIANIKLDIRRCLTKTRCCVYMSMQHFNYIQNVNLIVHSISRTQNYTYNAFELLGPFH